MPIKSFRLPDELLSKYDNLKQQERITNEADFFGRLLDCLEANNSKEKKFIPTEMFFTEIDKKEKEIRTLMLKIGELQGELNIYKQKALPKKSLWKRLFG